MSLVHDHKEIKKLLDAMGAKEKAQQSIYFNLIKGMVKLHQKYRNDNKYELSDEIRSLLNDIDIKIIQGTNKYKYEDIPTSLKGRQFDDRWEFIGD